MSINSITFFIIDDDPVIRKIHDRLIEITADNATSLLFENGETAKQYFSNLDINGPGEKRLILLLDLNMPVMNGWEFLSYLEDVYLPQNPQIKPEVFIVTSSIDRNDKMRSKEFVSVRGFYSKPLKKEHLIEILSP
ncbi:MAG: response regulator [Balneolales bacterium]|nr:response regulator [Balneolales bacterium]